MQPLLPQIIKLFVAQICSKYHPIILIYNHFCDVQYFYPYAPYYIIVPNFLFMITLNIYFLFFCPPLYYFISRSYSFGFFRCFHWTTDLWMHYCCVTSNIVCFGVNTKDVMLSKLVQNFIYLPTIFIIGLVRIRHGSTLSFT